MEEQKLLTLAAGREISVEVPATSANLGPGFDSLGLALELRDTLTVQTTDSGRVELEIIGEGAHELPRDESHLTVSTLRWGLKQLGFQDAGLQIQAVNRIPHGRGLGSSAATIVAALAVGNLLSKQNAAESAQRLDSAQVDREWLFQHAVELEGHPDNVAPAIYGGMTISWREESAFRTVGVPVAAEITPLLFVPAEAVATKAARNLLPAVVSHQNAAMNSGRVALLIQAITTNPELLLVGTRDYLHQQYRTEAMPDSLSLIQELRQAQIPAVISGAGPSVLVLASKESDIQKARETLALSSQTRAWQELRLTIAAEGAKIIEGSQE